MVWRKGRELDAGSVLMIDRARTWRNSMPRNSPRPTWRSTSGKSAVWASSPSVFHRMRGSVANTRSPRSPGASGHADAGGTGICVPKGLEGTTRSAQVVVLQPAGGDVGGVLLVDVVAL